MGFVLTYSIETHGIQACKLIHFVF